MTHDSIDVSEVTDGIVVSDPTTNLEIVISEDAINSPTGFDKVSVTDSFDTIDVVDAVNQAFVQEVQQSIDASVSDVSIHVVDDDNIMYAKRVDFDGEFIIYRGEAVVGSLNSDTSWRLRRLTLNSEDDVVEEWADGSSSFDKSWDDRLTFNYS